MDEDVDETVLSVLTRRAPLLDHLTTESTRKCDLVDELNISRSTIDRGIRELEHLNLIERDGRVYRTTLAGELALSEYDKFSNRLTDIATAREVLSSLPPTTILDPIFLDGATVLVSQRPDPQQPASELERLIESADHHRAFAPAFLDHLITVYRDAIVDGLECEFVLTPTVLDRLMVHHREPVTDALSSGRVELREAADIESIPYSLVVSSGADESVAALLVYVDEGLKGVIFNDDPAAVEWASSKLEAIWSAGKPLSFPNPE